MESAQYQNMSTHEVPARAGVGRFFIGLSVALLFCGHASLRAASMADYTAVPPLLQTNATPRVMLLMSNDHQLFKKAYSDYSDLNGDGELDTTYDDAIEYAGYFDSGWCYQYDDGEARFEPSDEVADGHQCTGLWSGNFLNWSTMTRMDIVRRVYYGGKRAVDTAAVGDSAAETVLERALLPMDAHAFVKVFEGSAEEVASYTPNPDGHTAISLCNVTIDADGYAKDSDAAPLVRVVYDALPLWASTDNVQCLYSGEADAKLFNGDRFRPSKDVGSDLVVHVQACVDAKDATTSDHCRTYGSIAPVAKPAGLLQESGEDGSIEFGLMTGSYKQKMAGAILRRNIMALAGNTDPADDEINLATGQFSYLNNGEFRGIIRSLDSLRVTGWHYGSENYPECSAPTAEYVPDKIYDPYSLPTSKIDVDGFKGSTGCQDWGNPLAEMYMEALRYFASEGNDTGPTSEFSDDDDSGLLSGLGTEAWNDPLAGAEPCSQCAIIVMSSGQPTFDADNLDAVSGLSGLDEAEISAQTDAVGVDAGLTNANVLVGNVGENAVDDSACSAKSISLLSDVLGICVEVPGLEGSFQLAGLASWAQTTDLRTEDGMDDMQNVDTYAVALADRLPSFSFDTSDGSDISIVPACQSSPRGQGAWSDCSIIDARIVEQRTVKTLVDGGEIEQRLYTRIDIVWEGAMWGDDYGMDGISTIEVCRAGTEAKKLCAYDGLVDPTLEVQPFSRYTADVEWQDTVNTNQLQVRSSVPQVISDYDLRFGVLVSGSNAQDGLHMIDDDVAGLFTTAWTDDYSCFDGSFYEALGANSRYATCQEKMVWGKSLALTATGAAVASIEDPLWYAAKYGNFDDSDTQRLPASTGDWDAYDLDGNSGSDGIPDAYFPVGNLSQLAERLTRVVEVIHRQAASGTSVAVTLERRDGVGATFQAYYYPNYKELGTNREVDWVGGLHALFLDGDLLLREDSDHNGVLSEADSRIKVYFDGTDTVVERYASKADYSAGNVSETVAFSELESIWDAKDQLAELSDAQVLGQRLYTSAQGRHIFTWMDQVDADSGKRDGNVDADEVVAFMPASFTDAAGYRMLGQTDVPGATDLVNYIRGSASVDGARSRSVTLPGSDGLGEWRLGDIVHSSPLIVGRPNDEYDIDYRDPTYTAFRDRYLNRRQVVYAGANDGMLHAFNAGFYSAGEATFATSGTHPVTGEAVTEYALGDELWAYVPGNLLPHLRWLKEPGYSHVFYVDGEPRSYDVNIFTPSDTHPGGWGTILVVGFRLGGGDISVTLGDAEGDVFTGRSAYVILDVTDPEQAPTVLAEITDPNLGYTTGVPALLNGRQADSLTGIYSTDEDAWYLVFGSGPFGADALSAGVSDQNAHLYLYNLKTLAYHDWDTTTDVIDAGFDLGAGAANSFVGDPTSVDWDKDYLDDVIYFGLVSGGVLAPTGSLERLTFDWQTAVGMAPALSNLASATMLDAGLPFLGAPTTFRDRVERRSWVLAGTGRFLTAADNADYADDVIANKFYGLVEPLADDGSFSFAPIVNDNLADTTDVGVLSDESVFNAAEGTDGVIVAGSATNVTDFDELLDATETAGGWYNWLGELQGLGARNYNGAIPINSGVGYVSFAPDQDVCSPSGYSQLSFRDARTGTASRNIFFSLEDVPLTVTKIGDAQLLNGDSNIRDGAVSRLTQVRTKDGIAVGSSNNYGGIQFDQVLSLSGSGKEGSGKEGSFGTGRQGWREIPIERN